uniref:Uncharacterized protein n=1 Tax=Streptomyces sp. F11 TaxID=319318 RepID=Q58IR4_9ACTN|nr:hypothetical protein [Streptomyces sp. F11]AAX51319.1 unknown [Streptomyces sp. F11]
MSPRPDADTRVDAIKRFQDLKQARDKAHEAAEQTKQAADEVMWQSIAAELDAGNALQADVVEATGFSRDHVLRRTKKYRKQT